MNREIKFRAWIKALRFHSDVTELSMSGWCEVMDYDYALASDDVVIEQFTGLLDCVSAEMYEGDICLVDGLGYCVVEIDPWHGVQFNDCNGQHVPAIDCVSENDVYEVVGNIHENPDLIK